MKVRILQWWFNSSWQIRFHFIRMLIFFPLTFIFLIGLIVAHTKWNFPRLLSFNYSLTIGILFSWLICVIGIKLALNSTITLDKFFNSSLNKENSLKKQPFPFFEDVFVSNIIMGSVLIALSLNINKKTGNSTICDSSFVENFLAICLQFVGCLLGLLICIGFIKNRINKKNKVNSDSNIKENLLKPIKIRKYPKRNNKSLKGFFNIGFFSRIFIPCAFGFYLALLLYPLKGNLYNRFLADSLFKFESIFFLFCLLLIFYLGVYLSFNNYFSIVEIFVGLVFNLIIAFACWDINRDYVDAGILSPSWQISALSLLFIFGGILVGIYGSYITCQE